MQQRGNWVIQGNVSFGTVFPDLPPGTGLAEGRPKPLFQAWREPQCPYPGPVVIQAAWDRGQPPIPAMTTDAMKLVIAWNDGNAKYGPVTVDFIAGTTWIPLSAADRVDVAFLNESNVNTGGKVPAPATGFNLRISIADISPQFGMSPNVCGPTFTQRFVGVAAGAAQVVPVPRFAQAVRVDSCDLTAAAVIACHIRNGNAEIIQPWTAPASAGAPPQPFQQVPAGAEELRFVNGNAGPAMFIVTWKLQL